MLDAFWAFSKLPAFPQSHCLGPLHFVTLRHVCCVPPWRATLIRCEVAAGRDSRLQAGRNRVGTFRQEFWARADPPGVVPQSPGFWSPDPRAVVALGPLTVWGEAMSSAAAEQTEMVRPHFCVDSLWVPILLPGGVRASVSNELNDFPSLSQEFKKGDGGQRVNANAATCRWSVPLDAKSLLSSNIMRARTITCIPASHVGNLKLKKTAFSLICYSYLWSPHKGFKVR